MPARSHQHLWLSPARLSLPRAYPRCHACAPALVPGITVYTLALVLGNAAICAQLSTHIQTCPTARTLTLLAVAGTPAQVHDAVTSVLVSKRTNFACLRTRSAAPTRSRSAPSPGRRHSSLLPPTLSCCYHLRADILGTAVSVLAREPSAVACPATFVLATNARTPAPLLQQTTSPLPPPGSWHSSPRQLLSIHFSACTHAWLQTAICELPAVAACFPTYALVTVARRAGCCRPNRAGVRGRFPRTAACNHRLRAHQVRDAVTSAPARDAQLLSVPAHALLPPAHSLYRVSSGVTCVLTVVRPAGRRCPTRARVRARCRRCQRPRLAACRYCLWLWCRRLGPHPRACYRRPHTRATLTGTPTQVRDVVISVSTIEPTTVDCLRTPLTHSFSCVVVSPPWSP